MLLPSFIFMFFFELAPIFGNIMAFQDYNPGLGWFRSPFVGWRNFTFMFRIPDSMQVFGNTLIIAVWKIILGLIAPIALAIFLNEIRSRSFRRTVQTLVYLPHFLSWVILAGIIGNLLSLNGMVNQFVMLFGREEPIHFLADNRYFRPMLIVTHIWKEAGFGTIIYLAAISNISPSLYETAVIDGAGRFQRMRYITIRSMLPTIVLLATLSLGGVLNAGFEQIFNLYNPLVYRTADIVDTYVYRVGLIQLNFSLGTAIGLMKSMIALVLISISYFLADRFANYRIF
ncbi:MAG: sugar ABC transporter permease [Spirochaetales bacterium]|jgi:putative aldouronate transport system permease protein|nr:sugar ABC transporter permease [Spirochaetales bacterium]